MASAVAGSGLMKKIIFSIVVSLGVSGIAFAKGDAKAGQGKVATCSACHGATGASMAPNFPHLAGQGERYLVKQITEIKAGERKVPEMAPFVDCSAIFINTGTLPSTNATVAFVSVLFSSSNRVLASPKVPPKTIP